MDDADAVVVTCTAIELLDGADNPRVRFDLDQPQQIDLLALQGAQSTPLLDNVVVQAGVYEQIRLIVDAPNASCQNTPDALASYITIDQTDFPLIVPSGGSSGLKLQGPITVAAGNQVRYTLDFDLRAAIAQRGATGCYNLRPVVRVVDNAQTGTIQGLVDPDLLVDDRCSADTQTGAGAAVYLFAGADQTPTDFDGLEPEPLSTALLQPPTEEAGQFSYELGFVLAGDYTLALSCDAARDEPESSQTLYFTEPTNAQVESQATTVVNFELNPS